MKKEQLYKLSRRVSEVAAVEIPIIVGSQSLYAVTADVPELVKRSIECDFLLVGAKSETFRAVIAELGFASEFQEQFGYFADPLGMATVVLPTGWQHRLQTLIDTNGKIAAFCLEVHDLAASKFIAGRDKDFEFLQEIFERNLADFDTFCERLKLILEMPQNVVVRPRIKSFLTHLRKSGAPTEIQGRLRSFQNKLAD